MSQATHAKPKKTSDLVMVSIRLSEQVRKAIDVMAKQESQAGGFTVTQSNIVSMAIMERYRRKKVKRKT